MKSHEIDYKIFGDDMQYVEVELDKGETVVGEAGAMMYMHDGIDYEAVMGDGSKVKSSFFDKMLDVGKRVLTNESMFLTHYTNKSPGKSQIAFAAPFPGKIIPIDLKKVKGEITCQKDSFLCAAKGTSVSITIAKKLGAGFFGGEGFILQKLEGDGKAFLHACGGICLKKLTNETLRVETGSIVAFTKDINYDITMVKNLKSMFFSGEGMFLSTLSGSGYVWLQTLPFSKLADRIILASNHTSGGGNRGQSKTGVSIIDLLN